MSGYRTKKTFHVPGAGTLLRSGGHPPEGTGVYQVPGADGDAFVFRYQVVPLWQLDARQMQAQLGPAAAPFCAAMQGADEAFIRELVEKVQTDPRLAPHDRRTTIQLLYIVRPGGFFTWNRSSRIRTFRS
jgi:hypothetical protein